MDTDTNDTPPTDACPGCFVCRPGDVPHTAETRFLASRWHDWPCPPRPKDRPRDGRVRVGFAAPVFGGIGGTETWHRTLIGCLPRGRVEVVGLAVTGGTSVAEVHGVPVRTGRSLSGLARECDVLVLWGLAKPRDHLPRDRGAWPAIVYVAHGDGSSEWTRHVCRSAAPDVTRFVGVSRAALDAIPATHRPSATVIENAVDPARVRPTRTRAEVRAELGLGGTVAVLYLGRLSSEKRPDLVVRAAWHLPDSWTVLIAGDGRERADLERIAPPHVRFLGARDDVGDLLAAADLLVSPSEQEGFGLSMAEAMLAGLPVIATPVGLAAAYPELVRAVPIDADDRAWALAIRRDWHEGTERRQRVVEARATAEVFWGVGRHAEAWTSLLAGFLATRT